MYILAAFLLIGFICNLLVKPLARSWFMTDAEVADLRASLHDTPVSLRDGAIGAGRIDMTTVLAWAVVGIPIAWGVSKTLASAMVLFR
jgi:hypothetical protein